MKFNVGDVLHCIANTRYRFKVVKLTDTGIEVVACYSNIENSKTTGVPQLIHEKDFGVFDFKYQICFK